MKTYESKTYRYRISKIRYADEREALYIERKRKFEWRFWVEYISGWDKYVKLIDGEGIETVLFRIQSCIDKDNKKLDEDQEKELSKKKEMLSKQIIKKDYL